jgi:hypothetical protein
MKRPPRYARPPTNQLVFEAVRALDAQRARGLPEVEARAVIVQIIERMPDTPAVLALAKRLGIPTADRRRGRLTADIVENQLARQRARDQN